MSSERGQIIAAEWEGHKNTILSLRRSGVSLKGKDGIMTKMKRDRGFTASPAQYELQFSKWGERKNLSANEWRLIFRIADQYDQDGMKCAVYMHKQLVRPSILKKKRRVYCKGQEYASRREVRVSTASLPECVEIRTSGSDSDVSGMVDIDDYEDILTSTTHNPATTINEPAPVATSSHMVEFGGFGTGDLYLGNQMPGPNQLSQGHGSTIGALSAPTGEVPGFGSSFLGSNYSFPSDAFALGIDASIPTDEQPIFTDDLSEVAREASLSFPLLHDEADYSALNIFSPVRASPVFGNGPLIRPDTPPGAVSNLGFIDTWTSDIPFLRFEKHLGSQGNLSLNTRLGLPSRQSAINRQSYSIAPDHAEESGSSHARQLFMHTRSLLFQDRSSTPGDALSHTEMVKSSLSSLLPPDVVLPTSLLSSRTATHHEVFGSSFYRLLIFAIENNFAGLEDMPIGAVLRFLKQDTQMHFRFLQYLRASPKYVSKALAEKLIRAAIENCDAPTVTELITTGLLTPDEIVCSVDGRRYTAVERSAMLRSIEVTKALLVAGADVNKTYVKEPEMDRGALELAIRKWGIYVRVDMQLINLLLDCGAEVCVELVGAAVRGKDADLIRALMSKFSPFEHSAAFRYCPFMADAVDMLNGELATMIIVQIVQACSRTGCGNCPKSHPRELQRSITLAAMRGYSELVAFLLDYTTDKGPPLAGAVRGGRKDIVELLLEKGANVDMAGCSIDGTNRFITTPLAEAIRADNNELVRDFENRGALSQINEKGRFGAAIYAASEVGNLTYAQRLLQMVPDMDGEILTPALNVSIIEGHEEIALTLLKAGADVNDQLSRGPPLLEALRRRSKILVHMILDRDVNINARGDIRGSDQPFLEEAARWGDVSVIKDLVSMGANVNNPSGETPVTAAVRARNKPLVELLVKDYGAQLNDSSGQGKSPLEAAISNKDIDMFQYLLDLQADPSCSMAIRKAVSLDRKTLAVFLSAFRAKYPAGKKGFGAAAVKVALAEDDVEVVDMLLEAKLDLNTISYMEKYGMESALGMAIRKYDGRNLDIIKKLLSAGGDPNSVVSTTRHDFSVTVWPRRTALLEAIHTKSKALVELLIDAGADIHRAARLGLKRTPLQHACEVGSIEIVELLLEKGVDVNEAPASRGGGTSLQLCAIKGYAGIADKLLKHGADVHAAPAEKYGQTALEGAAEHGRLTMLKVLWDAAVPKRFDSELCTRAMKLAEENGHVACRDFLRELCLITQVFIMPESFDCFTSQ